MKVKNKSDLKFFHRWLRPLVSGLSPLWAMVNGVARPYLSKKAWTPPCSVISVGNILAGGVGKTEVVALIARHYLAQNKKVTVALRGVAGQQDSLGCIARTYAEGLAKNISDEALVHLLKNPGVYVSVGAERAKILKRHWQELQPDVILLDDGFQHFSITRNLDVLVHNFSISWPVFRDFPAQFEKVDLLLNLTSTAEDNKIPIKWQGIPWVRAYYHPLGSKTAIDGDLQQLPSEGIAFCGIGNPERFKSMLTSAGLNVTSFYSFSDHKNYSLEDLKFLNQWANTHLKMKVFTTLKDFVKIQALKARFSFELAFELVFVDIDIRFLENESLFFKKL